MRINFKKTTVLALMTLIVIGVFAFLSPGEVLAQTSLESVVEAVDCGITNPTACAAVMSLYAMQGAGTILWMAGSAFNGALWLSIFNFSDLVNKIEAIEIVWKILRDVVNMAFIFILLYISIKTILGEGQQLKKMLVNTIIVALLINFSLFFTSVVIDAANTLAMPFYKAFTLPEEEVENALLPATDGGISNVFMSATGIGTLFSPSSENESSGEADIDPGLADMVEDHAKLIIVGLGGAVLLLILSFVFFTAALLFFVRFVVLIILMMLSPIAFVGWILPKMSEKSKEWMTALIDHAFFAPVFMLMIYVVARVANSGILYRGGTGKSYASALAGGGNSLELIISFLIICAMAIAALVISKSFMGSTSKSVVDWTSKTAGTVAFGGASFLGRQSAGRLARSAAKSDRFKDFAAKSRFGAKLYSGSQKVGSASFDVRGTKGFKGLGKTAGVDFGKPTGKGGFEKYVKDKVEKEKKIAKSLGKDVMYKSRRKGERLKAEEKETNIKKGAAKTELDAANSQLEDLRKSYDEAVLPETKAEIEKQIQEAKEVKDAKQATYEEALVQHQQAKEAHENEKLGKRNEVYAQKLTEDKELFKKLYGEGKATDFQRLMSQIMRGGFSFSVVNKEAAKAIEKDSGLSDEEQKMEWFKKKLKDLEKTEGKKEGSTEGEKEGPKSGEKEEPKDKE